MSLYKVETYIILTVFGYHFLYYSICIFPLWLIFSCICLRIIQPNLTNKKPSALCLALPPSEDVANINKAFEKNLYILWLQIIWDFILNCLPSDIKLSLHTWRFEMMIIVSKYHWVYLISCTGKFSITEWPCYLDFPYMFITSVFFKKILIWSVAIS